jgi:hypothetical protein
MKLEGTVFKYGDNVDTDVIIPARYLNSSDPKELSSHCMEDIDSTFTEKVREGDIIVAKNYLSEDEIDTLNRLVTIFLENAELRVKERKDLTISYWKQNVNSLLTFQGKDILSVKGTVSNDEAETKAREEYESFDARRKHFDAIQADQDDIKELEEWSKSNNGY